MNLFRFCKMTNEQTFYTYCIINRSINMLADLLSYLNWYHLKILQSTSRCKIKFSDFNSQTKKEDFWS